MRSLAERLMAAQLDRIALMCLVFQNGGTLVIKKESRDGLAAMGPMETVTLVDEINENGDYEMKLTVVEQKEEVA